MTIIIIIFITFWVHEAVESACVLQVKGLMFLEFGWITGRSVEYVLWVVIGNKEWGWGGGGSGPCAHSGRNEGGGIDGGDAWCSSGEVHGPQGVMVNLNSFSQCLGVPTITLTRHMTALSTAETTGREVAEQSCYYCYKVTSSTVSQTWGPNPTRSHFIYSVTELLYKYFHLIYLKQVNRF